jgi:hypothetical protein
MGKCDPEQGKDDKEDEEEEEQAEMPIAIVSEAIKAIRVVSCLYEARAGNSKIVSQIMDIEEHLELQYWACCRRHENLGLLEIDLRL